MNDLVKYECVEGRTPECVEDPANSWMTAEQFYAGLGIVQVSSLMGTWKQPRQVYRQHWSAEMLIHFTGQGLRHFGSGHGRGVHAELQKKSRGGVHAEQRRGGGHAEQSRGGGHAEQSRGGGHAEQSRGSGHAEQSRGGVHAVPQKKSRGASSAARQKQLPWPRLHLVCASTDAEQGALTTHRDHSPMSGPVYILCRVRSGIP